MKTRLIKTELSVLNTRTRFPFKYGIASLTAVPHLFIRATVEINGQTQVGIASEGLPPKWFTKDPDTAFRDDLADMLHVIESACGFAEQAGEAVSVYDLWSRTYAEQMMWATGEGYPPLLWALGVSLVERALIDAHCRAMGLAFHQAMRDNTFGLRLGEFNKELKGIQPATLLPEKPQDSVLARHTVGLADALTDDDITAEDRADDGLPQSLAACIQTYGLRRFKIKLSGDPDHDTHRLERIATLLDNALGADYGFTLDGNEQYTEVAPFITLFETLNAAPSLQAFMANLIFVEQPFHRAIALDVDTADDLLAWESRPHIIIDESDGSLGDAAMALDCGYVGSSHKNCKGVFKGVANACLMEHLRRENPDATYIQSAEDLACIGPVAMLQDLAVIATLGITHAERNGHHYFKGLSMFPEAVQQETLTAHGDLYGAHEGGFAALKISDGRIDCRSINQAPFGLAPLIDASLFTPLDAWDYNTLGS